MLVLLIAFQLSSTNCIPDYSGGMNCTTMSTQPAQLPALPEPSESTKSTGGGCGLCNLINIFGGNTRAHHRKAVGKMLADGDCAGAEKYALEQGELDLAERVRDFCSRPAVAGVSHQPR